MYIPEFNIAIEYDGIQHFIPIDFFGGIEKFEYCKSQDKSKELKCKEHNCILFRIRYDYDEKDYLNLVQNIDKWLEKRKQNLLNE